MDNSWGNSDEQRRKTKGFDWTNITIAVVLLTLLITTGILVIHWVVQNQSTIQSWALEIARPDWIAARRIAEKIQTDEGAIDVYRSNPKLSKKFKSEKYFVVAVTKWRSQLKSLPEALPTFESKRFGHAIGLGTASALIKYKMDSGSMVSFTWDASSDHSSRQLTDLEIE